MVRATLIGLITLCSAAAGAADWRPLPSPDEYQARVDLASVVAQQGYGRFTVHRAYTAAQQHPSGKEYYTARFIYVTDCRAGTAALAVSQYYGEDRKLNHAEVRKTIRKSELAPPEAGSDVAEAVRLACERLAQIAKGTPPDSRLPGQAAPAKRLPQASSGSGIIVSGNGFVLTNQHVVQQCSTYEVIDDANRRLKASLHAVDVAKDLALLMVEERFAAVAPIRRDAAPRLGEAVTIVGFPLVNVLGTRPTVGFGHVSSTVGIRGNQSQMQISVPVQRGNSGGPVFDQAGNVIGVVVSKLDALKVAERVGDLPQNVNFAIRGDVVRNFLEDNNIVFTASNDSARLENTEIASRGAAATVRVRCLRTPATGVAAPAAQTPQ
jgi:S1-C subfamily serine protease